MPNHTDEITDSLPSNSPDDAGHSTMTYSSLAFLECQIAARIVAWVNAHPELPYYREYIQMVTPDALRSEFTDRLAFGLYRHLDAPTWLSWHDAPGSFSSLWRAGLLRAARLLHSPA